MTSVNLFAPEGGRLAAGQDRSTFLGGVVFDLDGTLIDSETVWENAERSVAARHGVTWTAEDAADCFGLALNGTLQRMIERGVPLSVEAAREALLDEVAVSYRQQGVSWLPGAVELLTALARADVPAAVATMCFGRLTAFAHRAAPEGSIRAVVSGDELDRPKPHPQAFLRAIELLRLTPGDVVVVEDSLVGVTAAIASGAAVLAVPRTRSVYEQLSRFSGLSLAASLEQVDLGLLSEIRAGRQVDLWS